MGAGLAVRLAAMRFRLLSALIAALSLAFAAAGCGDDEPSTTTVTTTASSTSSSTESTTADETVTESTGVTTTTPGGGEEGPPAADQTVKSLTGFTSPSGNIGCLIDRSTVRCDIRDRDWEPPEAPADCDLDYGQGISLDAGSAPDFVCAGDTTLESGEALPYGQSIQGGLLRCQSEESGMTCRDIETGRGFTISKQRYELF
jgi:hypothetical protein